MTFYKITPTTEGTYLSTSGIVITKILFLICVFKPDLFRTEIASGLFFYHIYIGLAAIWLAAFVIHDIYTVLMGKRVTDGKTGTEEHMPLKNIFVIFMIGYLILEITSIETDMLKDTVFFYLAFSVIAIFFALLMGKSILTQETSSSLTGTTRFSSRSHSPFWLEWE